MTEISSVWFERLTTLSLGVFLSQQYIRKNIYQSLSRPEISLNMNLLFKKQIFI